METTMNDKNASVEQRIGDALHEHLDSVVRQPVPQRWMDLLKRLNEKQQAGAEQPDSGDRQPGKPTPQDH